MPQELVVAQPKKKALSWGEVDWMIEIAVSEMRERNYHPDRIIPIGGGGIVPAAIMAYRFYKKDHLPISLMPPVYAKSYGHDNKQHSLSMYWPQGLEAFDAATTLFVDDILDTGETHRVVMERMPKSRFYSLVTKIDGHPNFYSAVDRDHLWWDMPWEKVSTK